MLNRLRTMSLIQIVIVTAMLFSINDTMAATNSVDLTPLSTRLSFTQSEQAFIKENRVIKVQSEASYPPFNFAINGKPAGFSIDYIRLLSRQIGLQVEFTQGKNWGEYLDMLKNKQLDAMVNIMDTPTRRKFADFTTEYAQTFIMAVTKSENTDIVTSKDSLNQKRIAVVKGYAGFGIIKEIIPNATYVFAEDMPEALTLVATDRADVLFANGVLANYYITKYFVTGLSIQAVPKELSFPRQHLRLATHKDNQVLLGLLQKAIYAIPEQQLIELRRKWFGTGKSDDDNALTLSKKQKIWLLRNRALTVNLPKPGLPLGDWVDDKYRGILADFVTHFDNTLGTRWHQAQTDSKPDLTISNIADNQLQGEYLFTQPFLNMPVVVLSANPERVFISDLNNLGKIPTAVVAQAAYLGSIKKRYPLLVLTPYQKMSDAILAANTGKVEILLCPMAYCSYLMNELGINNLRVVGQTEFLDSYGFAIHKSKPQLLNIIENVLSAMPPQRKNAIFKQWNTREEVLVKTNYDEIKYLLSIGLILALLIVLWNRNIAKYAKSVEHAHDELKQTQSKLVQSEKMASLGTLTSGVAHEINNPTNFVHVGAQNLEADLMKVRDFIVSLADENADEEFLQIIQSQFSPLFEHITTIQDGTARIKTIVKDLRSFSRLEGVENKTVDVRTCLQSTINLVRTKYIEIADIVTEFDEIEQLSCHPAQLNQVFMNLIVNSCHAIEQKQREDSQAQRGRIHIKCQQNDNEIVVLVADNGCGMTEETKNKLFEPFYTTKAVGEGTGLGMAISFGIINEHKGHMEVHSTLGQGTQITVHLPLKDIESD